ncbi:GGDEF domain-containing protein [Azospirillum doebereinerae]
MTRKQRIFLSLCAALLVTDVGLVAMNAVTARGALMAAMRDRAASLREGFAIALYTTELKLTEIASFVAEIEEVRAHLSQAGTILAQTPPGGAEPPDLERARQSLLNIVGPRWTQLRFRYLLRQLSFYLPPDGTVLLRADIPYAYGDRARQPDSLASMAASTGRPAAGFDIDRLSVGLRAAVPVGGDRPLGVVEVGTALDTMMIPICPNARCGTAILLDQAAVERRMAPEAVAGTFTDDRRIGPWLIEASSNPAITRTLMGPDGPPIVADDANLVEVGNRWLAVTRFSLADHLGKEDPARPPVGTVVAWMDVDEAVHAFERTQLLNLGVAVLAFLLAAGLVRLLLAVVVQKLEGEVRQRTAEVQALLVEVSHLANHDPLTGLFNRRAFTEGLNAEITRAQRNGGAFSLVSLDLDRFKGINDTHGHPTGDAALRMVAALVRDTIRTRDSAGRLGGEEFGLLLPDTGAEGAAALAERLRDRVATHPLSTPSGAALTVTFSAGVAEWQPGLDEETLLRRVDEALYAAKAAGQNRVMRAEAEAPACTEG